MRARHFFLSFALHLTIFVLALVGVQCSPKISPPVVIEATLVTGKNEQATRKQPSDEPKPDPGQQEELRAQQEKAEQEQQAAQEARRRQETERQAQAQASRAAAQAAQRQAEQDALRKTEERAAQQAAADAQRQATEQAQRQAAEAARRAAEQEAKRKAEEEAKRKAAAEAARKRAEEAARKREFAEALQAEENRRAEAAYISGIQNEWVTAISRLIGRNWLRPPGLSDDLLCQVRVELLPNGQIVNARVVRASGSSVYDDSVLRAVLKSDPLPLPSDPTAFERVLLLNFTPRDLGY